MTEVHYPDFEIIDPSRPRMDVLYARERSRAQAYSDSLTDLPFARPKGLKPLTIQEYVEENERVIPHLSAIKIDEFLTTDDFETQSDPAPKGVFCCVAAFPFDPAFRHISNMEVNEAAAFLTKNQFLNYFLIEKLEDGKTGRSNLGSIPGYPGYYSDYLPKEVRRDVSEGGCRFLIDYPEKFGHPDNKVWFIQQYNRALQNLRTLLTRRER